MGRRAVGIPDTTSEHRLHFTANPGTTSRGSASLAAWEHHLPSYTLLNRRIFNRKDKSTAHGSLSLPHHIELINIGETCTRALCEKGLLPPLAECQNQTGKNSLSNGILRMQRLKGQEAFPEPLSALWRWIESFLKVVKHNDIPFTISCGPFS